MKRDELTELHFITPHQNLPDILRYGILSHYWAQNGIERGKIKSSSIAMPEVQNIRDGVRVPGGQELHRYANLYFCARNPMMFKRKEQHLDLCVLRVDTAVLDIEGVIITDMNASKSICRFAAAPDGIAIVNCEKVFAEDWRHMNDSVAYERHKAMKCAEALIPKQVPVVHIVGAYVSCLEVIGVVKTLAPQLPVTINGHLFFYEGP